MYEDYYYEDEKLYSTGFDELDSLMEKAFCDGYEYAQREFSKFKEIQENFTDINNPSKFAKTISPATRARANTNRWNEFNEETGGKKFRLNTGQARKDFHNWQQETYGNII